MARPPSHSKTFERFEKLVKLAVRPGTEEEGRTAAIKACRMLVTSGGQEGPLRIVERDKLHALLLENRRLRHQLERRTVFRRGGTSYSFWHTTANDA